jgi:hypothetical protein
MEEKPSKWTPAALMVSAVRVDAMCASKSSCDCHFSFVTNVAGTGAGANSSQETQPWSPLLGSTSAFRAVSTIDSDPGLAV